MFGNVNTTYRINLLPLLSSAVAIDSSENRVLIVEKLDPVNGDEAPIASDKNVSWAHDGRFYVFGGYGNEPERGDHYRRVVQSSCQFLPDPSAPWVSSDFLTCDVSQAHESAFHRTMRVTADAGGTTNWPVLIPKPVSGHTQKLRVGGLLPVRLMLQPNWGPESCCSVAATTVIGSTTCGN